MVIQNGMVFDESASFIQKKLYIEGEEIAAYAEGELIDATDCYVIPGLIDMHIHACMGYDVCDGTSKALDGMASYLLENGITTFCPTTMTLSEEQLSNICRAVAEYDNENGATVAGLYLEGPFLSKEKCGAQNPKYLKMPNVEMVERLQHLAQGKIKVLAIAPELEGACECIEKLAARVRISVAHTMADYEKAKNAFGAGAMQVTHLYNAMPAFSHRKPGVIGAAFDASQVCVELICDGIHIHPSTVRATFQMFGEQRIILISDSMMACGLEDGQYALGGQEVRVRGRLATLTKDNTIAGSVTNLMDCVRTAVKEMGIPLESAVRCATMNPAKAMGIDKKYGSLALGKAADIVILDRKLEIRYVIKNGRIVKARL